MKKIFKILLNNISRPWLITVSYWVRPIITFYLKGNNFTDPIDGKSFRRFLPYGYEKQRENALSPSTLSLERHRLLWLYLKNETNFFSTTKKLKTLHIAPEQCFLKLFKKQRNLEYITADLESPIADVKADICNLPFEDNSFDLIFSKSSSLSLVKSAIDVLSSLLRSFCDIRVINYPCFFESLCLYIIQSCI